MKVLNLAASTNDAGDKHLDVNVYGVIAQGWSDTVDAAAIAQSLSEHKDAKTITVHINSVGGDMFDGIAIHNLLRGHGAPVTSIVEGLAASAASIIAMTGKTVMGSGSMMLIHNPWTVAMGDAKELRRVAADLDKARESLLSIYKAKTGKDGTELKALLDAETLMTAEQAKRNGFADEIAEDAPAVVEARGTELLFNQVAFPRDRLPIGVLNMAQATPPAPEKVTPPAPVPAPIQAASPPPEGALTREIVAAKAPDLLAKEREAGAAAERERIKAIEALGIKGCDALVFAAKFDKPIDARDLAVAVLQAANQAGTDLLAARRNESKVAAGVHQSTPEAAQTEEQRAIENMKRIAQQINASRKGGK